MEDSKIEAPQRTMNEEDFRKLINEIYAGTDVAALRARQVAWGFKNVKKNKYLTYDINTEKYKLDFNLASLTPEQKDTLEKTLAEELVRIVYYPENAVLLKTDLLKDYGFDEKVAKLLKEKVQSYAEKKHKLYDLKEQGSQFGTGTFISGLAAAGSGIGLALGISIGVVLGTFPPMLIVVVAVFGVIGLIGIGAAIFCRIQESRAKSDEISIQKDIKTDEKTLSNFLQDSLKGFLETASKKFATNIGVQHTSSPLQQTSVTSKSTDTPANILNPQKNLINK